MPRFGKLPLVAALFFGIKAAVLAIVIEALLRVARRALKLASDWWIAAVAFLALYVFDAPFPLVIVAAALVGFFRTPRPAGASRTMQRPDRLAQHRSQRPRCGSRSGSVRVGAHHRDLRPASRLQRPVALFFSKLAIVTFGGAYAVLTYMAQQAVETYRLAHARRDGRRPGPRRNDAGPA